MASLKGITLSLICICILQQILQANTQAKKGKGRQRQHSLTPKPTAAPRIPEKSSSKDPNVDSVLFKGRISNRDGTRCTWAATEGGVIYGLYVLSITCKKGTEKSLQCEYTAKPRLCPEYTPNVDAFWKQIGISLKRQKTMLCRNARILIKAKMCRKAPKRAHFALNTRPKVQPASARKNQPCANLKNTEKLAEEYCGSSWSSFCTFFFAMIETEDC